MLSGSPFMPDSSTVAGCVSRADKEELKHRINDN